MRCKDVNNTRFTVIWPYPGGRILKVPDPEGREIHGAERREIVLFVRAEAKRPRRR